MNVGLFFKLLFSYGLFKKKYFYLTISIVLYLAGFIWLMPMIQYSINPDGIAYIHNAESLLRLDLDSASIGHWSPLYSVLLAPLIGLTGDVLFAVTVLSGLIGLFAIFALYAISTRFLTGSVIRNLLLITSVPLFLNYSLRLITPDVLLTGLFFVYMWFVLDQDLFFKRKFCGLAGMFAGIAYLAKAYMFPFFLVHFSFLLIYQLFILSGVGQTKIVRSLYRKKVLVNYFIGLGVFFLITAPWIVLLSDRHETFTYSTAGHVGFAVVGPESPSPDAEGLPIYHEGLFKPPNQYATSIWDDPSKLHINSWSPFSSLDNLIYMVKHVISNVQRLFLLLTVINPLWLAAVTASVVMVMLKIISLKSLSRNDFVVLGTIPLFLGGYLLTVIHDRYITGVYFLLILISIKIMCLFKIARFRYIKVAVIVLLLSAQMINMSYKIYTYNINTKPIYSLALDLSGIIKPSSFIASNDGYGELLFISYSVGSQYYGITKYLNDAAKTLEELRAFDIDYYFVWNSGAEVTFLSSDASIVYDTNFLIIYEIHK